jgi:hypothetical protein
MKMIRYTTSLRSPPERRVLPDRCVGCAVLV